MVQISIPHIKIAKNNYGKKYYYDRITGKRILSKPGTASFILEVENLRAGNKIRKTNGKVETFGQLIAAYKASPEYERLKERTKSDYNKVFNYLKPLDNVRLRSIDGPYISRVKAKAFKKHKRTFANYCITMFSILFNWGIEPGHTKSNPAEKVKKIKRPKDAREVNRRWHEYEINTVLKHAEQNLKIAIALGVYTGLREGDVVSLPLSGITETKIHTRQGKNGEKITIPIHRDLKAYIIKAKKMPNRKAVTIVMGMRGRSYTASGFRGMFFKLIRELERKELVQPGLTFHGLRHTVGTTLAEAGASDQTIQSVLGHLTTTQAQEYRRDANKKKGAARAIKLMERSRK